MQNDELLDLVNENDEVVGTVYKSEAHKDITKIHREIAAIIFNHNGETLLQQRSSLKKSNPLKWGVACAGHVGADEEPAIAVNRELREELGFTTDPKFFKKLFHKDIKNTESKFYWIYYGFYDSNEFKLQKEEVEAVKWVKLLELEKFFESNGGDSKDQACVTTLEIAKNLGLI